MPTDIQPNADGTCSRECEQWMSSVFEQYDPPACRLTRKRSPQNRPCPIAHGILMDVARASERINKNRRAIAEHPGYWLVDVPSISLLFDTLTRVTWVDWKASDD